jgi:hypothetical protein
MHNDVFLCFPGSYFPHIQKIKKKFALLHEEQFFLKIKMITINCLFYILLFFMKNKIFILYLLLFMNNKNPKNVEIIPWEKFRVQSALVPSKISIANKSRNFSLGVLVFYYGYSEESTLEKIPTYFRKKFQHIFGKISRNFSKLTLRIFCFTGDGKSWEIT